jgi:hypothetical protein
VAVSASPFPFARVTKALEAFVPLPNEPRQTLYSFVYPLTHLIYRDGLLFKGNRRAEDVMVIDFTDLRRIIGLRVSDHRFT